MYLQKAVEQVDYLFAAGWDVGKDPNGIVIGTDPETGNHYTLAIAHRIQLRREAELELEELLYEE